jgi:hypothetical protein
MTDIDDEAIALLRQLGDLLKRSAADDLAALLSGSAKLAIVPKNWRPPAKDSGVSSARAPRQAPRSLPSAATIRAQLVDAQTSSDREKILTDLNLSQAEARRLAADLGAKGASKLTTDLAIAKILDYFADLDVAERA